MGHFVRVLAGHEGHQGWDTFFVNMVLGEAGEDDPKAKDNKIKEVECLFERKKKTL
jgi:hypothetical protein